MPCAGVQDCDVLDTLLVDQSPQFSIDLASREVLRVELRAITVDFGNVRDLVVELDEAARIEQDLFRLAPVGRYRLQTITSPS